MSVHAGRISPHNIFMKCIRSHGDNRNGPRPGMLRLPDGIRRLVSVHYRHLHIHQYQIITFPAGKEFVHGFPAVPGTIHCNPCHLKQLQGNFPVQIIVLGQQYMISLHSYLPRNHSRC